MKSIYKFIIYSLLAIFWAWVFMLSWQRHGRVSSLVDQDDEFVRLVHSVLPSVVSIDATGTRPLHARRYNEKPTTQNGAGVIVSADGYIATNYHVVKDAARIHVSLNNALIVVAQHVGSDPASDIAILKIDVEGLQPIPFADSELVRVAQRVFAVGNPLGLQETVTQGIISAKDRRATSEAANEFFQTDAAINPGNSGGPLVDMRGRLVGITSLVRVDGKGIAFAIPSNTVMRIFQSIRDHGQFIRPWLGVVRGELSPYRARQLGLPNTRGALIAETYPNSPALQAGLQGNDVVVSYNGKPIVDWVSLRNRIAETPIGDTISLVVIRDREKQTLEVTITAETER